MSTIPRLYDSGELFELARKIHKTACDKGWWTLGESDDEILFKPGDIEEKIVLVVSELSEAFEEYRNPELPITIIYNAKDGAKPEGFPIEMADAYIRILDLVMACKAQLLQTTIIDDGRPPWTSVGAHIHMIMGTMLDDGALYRPAMDSVLALALARIEDCCRVFKVDLKHAIAIKMVYNETRPFRHGNKRA